MLQSLDDSFSNFFLDRLFASYFRKRRLTDVSFAAKMSREKLMSARKARNMCQVMRIFPYFVHENGLVIERRKTGKKEVKTKAGCFLPLAKRDLN